MEKLHSIEADLENFRLQAKRDFDRMFASLACLETRMSRRLAESRARVLENEGPVSYAQSPVTTAPPHLRLYGTVELREARELLATIMPMLTSAMDCVRTPIVRDEIALFIRRARNILEEAHMVSDDAGAIEDALFTASERDKSITHASNASSSTDVETAKSSASASTDSAVDSAGNTSTNNAPPKS